jgi:hypothetical protein
LWEVQGPFEIKFSDSVLNPISGSMNFGSNCTVPRYQNSKVSLSGYISMPGNLTRVPHDLTLLLWSSISANNALVDLSTPGLVHVNEGLLAFDAPMDGLFVNVSLRDLSTYAILEVASLSSEVAVAAIDSAIVSDIVVASTLDSVVAIYVSSVESIPNVYLRLYWSQVQIISEVRTYQQAADVVSRVIFEDTAWMDISNDVARTSVKTLNQLIATVSTSSDSDARLFQVIGMGAGSGFLLSVAWTPSDWKCSLTNVSYGAVHTSLTLPRPERIDICSADEFTPNSCLLSTNDQLIRVVANSSQSVLLTACVPTVYPLLVAMSSIDTAGISFVDDITGDSRISFDLTGSNDAFVIQLVSPNLQCMIWDAAGLRVESLSSCHPEVISGHSALASKATRAYVVPKSASATNGLLKVRFLDLSSVYHSQLFSRSLVVNIAKLQSLTLTAYIYPNANSKATPVSVLSNLPNSKVYLNHISFVFVE